MAKKELRHVGGKLEELHLLLDSWCDMQSRYALIEEETGYDSSEGANTSLLIAAAHMLSGWTGLAEVWVERQHIADIHDADKKTIRRGLLDAYIANTNHGYAMEFKQAWILIKQNETEIHSGSYSSLLLRAREQVAQLNFEESFASGEDITRLYGAFLLPTYDPTKRKIKRSELFQNMVKHCEANFDAFAVFVPALSRKDCNREEHNSCRPLVALVLNTHGDDEVG